MTSSDIKKTTSKMMSSAPRNLSTSVPSCFNWRERGAVGPVENQGMCGSCWAFGVIGNIEGVWKVKKGELLRLSKQQLVDCMTKSANGCNGGGLSGPIDELAEQGGIQEEKTYPYKEQDGVCRYNKQHSRAYVSNSIGIDGEDNQAAYLVKNGPLVAAINANGLHFLKGGVLDLSASDCDPAGLNHAVLLVGYGTEGNIPYWEVKNSWGVNWGDKGYFKIRRNAGTCGIGKWVASAVIK